MQKLRLTTIPSNPHWERIEAVIKHYQFRSVSAFARHIGLKRAENLYQIRRGNNGISPKLAATINTSFPKVSKAWLLTGEQQMFTQSFVSYGSCFE